MVRADVIPAGARRARFTLIELLVVIAIIGILASLLLPALRRAKDKAVQVQCQGNQKNISQALTLYSDDWQMFPPYHDYDPAPAIWHVLVQPYTGEPKNISRWDSIMHCPADKTVYGPWNSPTRNIAINGSMKPNIGSWYGRIWPQSAGATHRRWCEIKYPSELCLCGDGAGSQFTTEWGAGGRYWSINAGNLHMYVRHGTNLINVSYTDGHVGSVTNKWFLQEAAAGGSTSTFFDWDVSDVP